MGTTGQSITLANSIIGVGILAMPFCFQQCGVLLATLILMFMGLVSRLCCYFLLKSAIISRRRTFEFLAFHVFGPAGKMAVEVGIIGFLMGTCIAYFVVVGDLGPQIVAKMFNINQSDILRTSIMVIVSLVCVLPLGLLRNVDSLSNVSAATIGFYFCLVIKVIEEAASQLWAGDWHRRVQMWRPAGLLQCVPIFSMALFCQTQLFEIFESHPSISLEKMNVVTKNAINICKCVYFTLGLFGYIAFGSQNISGNILMSLSPTMSSDVIKLGFVMSLAFSFPLIIFPCRASLYSFLYKKVHSSHHDHIINHSIPETTFRCITVAIIVVALIISLLIPNIELVLGLVGSTIGVLICVVFPAACFVNVTFKDTNERVLAKGIVILGLVIMVLGTFANLQAAEQQVDKYDGQITQERIDQIVEDFFQKWDKNDGDKPADRKSNGIVTKLDPAVEAKESEVQPPNPVPPESASNEKRDGAAKLSKLDDKRTDNKQIAEPVVEKSVDNHPKDLQTKLSEIKSNGESKNAIIDQPPSRELPKPQNVQEKTQDKIEIQEKTQEKIDMMKQQKIIETIKQHGEEQKELMKEQIEILGEIIKTKNEIEQDKKDEKPVVDTVEAKNIAVESIQKIADIAIQSLSGVSDKPAGIQPGLKENEPLEKIANEAVKEIAKKAVESIVAIHEIKEKPKQKDSVVSSAIAEDQNFAQNVLAQNSQNMPSNNANVKIPGNVPIAQNLIMLQEAAQKFIANNAPNAAKPAIAPNQVNQANNAPSVNINQVNVGNNVDNGQIAIEKPANQVNNNAQFVQQAMNGHQHHLHLPQQPVINGHVVNPAQQPAQVLPLANVNSVVNGQQAQILPSANVNSVVNGQPAQILSSANVNSVVNGQPAQILSSANVYSVVNGQPAQILSSANVNSVVNGQPAQILSSANLNSVVNRQQAQILPSANVNSVVNGQPAQVLPSANVNPVVNGNIVNPAQQPVQNLPSAKANLPIANANVPIANPVMKQPDIVPQNVNLPVNNLEKRDTLAIIQKNEPNPKLTAQNGNALNAASSQVVAKDTLSQVANPAVVQDNLPHSHSPDEPQSYKVGEDSQLKSTMQKNIANNVPVPIAIKGNAKLENENANRLQREILQMDDKISSQNGASDVMEQPDNSSPRQKREVVDCTEKSLLQPEDKEICDALITNPKFERHSEDILPANVDLNKVLVRNGFDAIHHVRSLKSYEER